MKLNISIEKIKDASKKVKQAMIVTFIDKDSSKTIAVCELDKDSFLLEEFNSLFSQMKELKKQKDKLAKEKLKLVDKTIKSKTLKK